MGNDQSTPNSSSGVSSSFSFSARKKTRSSFKDHIVVVNAAGQPVDDPEHDEDLKRLRDAQRFLPLLKGCLPGHRDSPEIFNKVDPKPFARFTHRLQLHLTKCSSDVNKAQNEIFTNIQQVDQSLASVSAKLVTSRQQFSKFSQALSKMNKIHDDLELIDCSLQELLPALQTINEIFPVEERLPALQLQTRSSYSSIGHSEPTTPAL